MHGKERMETSIRRIINSDRKTIKKLIDDVNIFTKDERDCLNELLDIYLKDKEQKDYEFYCCCKGYKMFGFICFGKADFTDGVYDLYWIVVSPSRQRNGVGHSLLSYLEKEIRKRGGRKILIETSSQPAYGGTRMFYEKNGFSPEGRILDFYRKGDDKIFYSKNVN